MKKYNSKDIVILNEKLREIERLIRNMARIVINIEDGKLYEN